MPTGFRTTKTQAGSYRQGRNSKMQWQRMRKNHSRYAFIGAGALVNTLLWFTTLSGSGKSTIAHSVEERLFSTKCRVTVLDGDNVRHGLCGDLGFSGEDRSENIRRIGEMTKLFIEAGMIIMTAFISPFKKIASS